MQAAVGVGSIWLILGLFAVQQSFFAINSPTRSALLPRIVPLEQLPAANSLNTTVLQAGAIAGPLVGGALIPVLGFSSLYLADTICLFATLWAVILLPPMPPQGVTGRAGLRSVLEGFAYLRGHKVLLMSFLVDIIAMVFGMPRALFPQIAHESFGGPVDGGIAFAALFAGIPAGAVLGGLFSGWISRVSRQGLAVVVAIVVWGAGIIVFGVAALLADGRAGAFLALGVLGLVIGGAADTASASFRSTMLQEAAGDAVRGRLQGVFTVVVAGGPRVADVAHGGVAAAAGAGATVAGGGVLVIVLVVVAASAIPVFVRYRVHRPTLEP
jgi:MFS family permease